MLTEDKIETKEPVPNTDTNQDLLNTIKELKENSVSRSEYDKLRNERKSLLDMVASGQSIHVQELEKIDSYGEIVKRLNDNKYATNLDCAKDIVALSEACEREGLPSPFLPTGTHATVKQSDMEIAERFYKTLKDCIDRSNNDPRLFNGNLERSIRR